MSHVQTAQASHWVFEKISATFNAFGASLVRLSEANALEREVERLNALSDEDLGKLGMSRSDIPHRVFLGQI